MEPKSEHSPTLLIVDDEAVNRKVMEMILRKAGYQTVSASSGAEARALAEEHLPDLILLDIVMKGEDGFDTCAKLKDNPLTTDIPVIFVSAMDDVSSKVKGLSIGAVDYICKPFEKAEVIARTRIHLKLSHALKTIIQDQTAKLRKLTDAQQSILVKPEDFPDAHFAVSYKPFQAAGGDFYEVYPCGEGIYGYFIADISGHDLGAGYITSALKALIQQNASPIYTPEETMKIMNRVLTGILSNGAHLSACCTYLNRTRKEVKFIFAGHPPVIHLRNGEATVVEGAGDILGAFEHVMFEPVRSAVKPGDRLFLYTDGMIESFGPGSENRKSGIKVLTEACEATSGMELGRAVEEIMHRLFPREEDQEDDLTLMAIDV